MTEERRKRAAEYFETMTRDQWVEWIERQREAHEFLLSQGVAEEHLPGRKLLQIAERIVRRLDAAGVNTYQELEAAKRK